MKSRRNASNPALRRAAVGLIAVAIALCGRGATRADEPARAATTQGWTVAERADFDHLALGSELFPLAWAEALDSAITGKPFLTGLDRHGLIDDPADPNHLPIGLTAARAKFGTPMTMLGINCAACHVTVATYKGKSLRIDGAPNPIDMITLNADLADSTTKLATDPAAFAKFVLLVVGNPEEKLRVVSTYPYAYQVLATMAAADAKANSSAMRTQLTAALAVLFAPRSVAWPVDCDPEGTPILGDPVAPEWLAKVVKIEGELAPALDALLLDLSRSGVPLGPLAGAARSQAVAQLATHLATTLWYLKQQSAEMQKQVMLRSFPGGTAGGPGRVDDFRLARNLTVNKLSIAFPGTAPSSIPILWGTDRVQWLGWDATADSTMERNIGTAVAIGAVLNRATYDSSIAPYDVFRLEEIASKVQPPAWPTALFGPLDAAKVERGASLFKARCVNCHLDEAALKASAGAISKWIPDLTYGLDEVGTDPNRAVNFVNDFTDRSAGSPLPDSLKFLLKMLYRQNGVGPLDAEQLLGGRTESWRATGRYAGRPLRSIWAAAPYLHNDSVPTLRDLLLPAAQRPVKFRRGGREFDPVNVGFIEPPADASAFLFDTTLSGNHNSGHEYGVDLPEADKSALIEYLKAN